MVKSGFVGYIKEKVEIEQFLLLETKPLFASEFLKLPKDVSTIQRLARQGVIRIYKKTAAKTALWTTGENWPSVRRQIWGDKNRMRKVRND